MPRSEFSGPARSWDRSLLGLSKSVKVLPRQACRSITPGLSRSSSASGAVQGGHGALGRVQKGPGSEAAGPPTGSFTSRDLQLAYAACSAAYLFCQRSERGGNRRSQSSLCFIIYVFTQSLLERSPLQFTVEGS